MNNKELIERWKDMLSTAPCIALLEDIDTIFDGRTNISGIQGGGLTFDCLLNVLDGVTPNDGLFLAVTTNRVEKLDPALGVPTNGHSTRPGRIDKAICMAPPDDAGRTKIATRILSDWKHVIPSIVSEGEKDTGAQFQNRCCELALKLYWTKGA
jgi:SpoVK/Ycf46/Vps4 family AAA+-type ATPase